MSEQNRAKDPAELHRIKAELYDLWERLPSAHQATTSLVLINRVLEGDMGEWLAGVIALKSRELTTQQETDPSPAPLPVSWLSREDLLHSHPELADEITALRDDQVEYIAERVGDALQETYWQALDMTLTDFFSTGDDEPDR